MFELASIDVGLMHAYASSHHAHLLAHRLEAFEPPKVRIWWPTGKSALGGLGGDGISWPLRYWM